MRTWTLCRASICLLLAVFFLPWSHATPGFTGGITAISVLVLEDTDIGTVFASLSVTDPEDPAYSIPEADITLNNNNNGLFSYSVQGTQVQIGVAASLDGQAGEYAVDVILSQVQSVTVNIEVRRTNFAPTFYSSHYFATIAEDLEVGAAVIATIEAVDFDLGTNGVFEYSFENPSLVSSALEINPSSGVISLVRSIDYDNGDTSFEFKVLAKETLTSSMLSATASVHITVMNVNDNPPIFQDPAVYVYSITENSNAGLQTSINGVTIISASDGDAGIYGEITYELTGAGVGALFDVEVMSGGVQLKTLSSLNREDTQAYTLTLTARDSANPPLADTVEMQVTVEDVNDLPPVFSVSEYHIRLSEADDHSNFVTFHATDGDAEAPNNRVTYLNITRTDTAGENPFTLNRNTGTVSVNGADLNYEVDASYTLTITARDGGDPSIEAEATLCITIVSINQHPPMFTQSSYTAQVMESLDVGGEIGLTVRAEDDMEGHTVEYSINHSFEDGDFFNINENSGLITLARSLNTDPPSNHDTFTFVVVATDIPPEGDIQVMLTGQAQVVVTVMDVNDNAPVISSPDQNPVILEIEEATAVLEINLFTMMAGDIDGDSDGESIIYSLNATDGSLSFFELGRDSGVFKQTGQVDREGCDPVPCHYVMTASACDEATPPMCSMLDVTITVLDINDNPPMMTNDPLTDTKAVPECQVGRRLLSRVHAVDNIDTGDFREVAYEIVTGDADHIILNEGTGQLSLGSEELDYETGRRSFSLTVRAIDNPDGEESERLISDDNFVQMITVGDCNDEPPVFTDTTYDFSVIENAASGPISGPTISSTDADSTTPNQAVTYHAIDLGPDSWFDITTEGIIYIRDGQTVDREDSDILIDSQGNGVVTFSIEAVNSASTGTLTSAQNAWVVITISDQNDNAPIMDAMPLSGSEAIIILEDTPPGTILTVVQATDLDVGGNAHIHYQITERNDLGKFSVDGETGIVTLLAVIDFETEPLSYTITIVATNDMATDPPVTDQNDIVLTIRVEGTNEHGPVFNQASYNEEISEHNVLATTQQHSAGDVIVIVSATDADADPNDANHDDIEYLITGGNEDDIFEIRDPLVGNIALKNPEMVDYERVTSYFLVIEATDLVLPVNERKTNTTHVNIKVVDVNDNVPVLSSNTYTGFVNEEESVGTTVILRTPITATDVDSLGGLEVREFDITTTGDPQPDPFQAFTISENGTSLTTTLPIDREEFGNIFTFQITVTDSGGNEDKALVTIDIVDINDNTPQIQETPEELFITIPENHPVGSIIARITAVDSDLGSNAEFSFTMQGGAGYFEIGGNSGVVKLVASLQALEPPQIFPLTVYAIDRGSLNSSITFQVNLTYSNDHPPIFDPALYFGSVMECADDGTDIMPMITISATDDDSNAMVSYYIESTDDIGILFRLDDRGGVADILTQSSGKYDRETADILRFVVFATDNTLGTGDDSAHVTITVTDCNDNNPIFTQELYEVDVYEGTVSGSTVIQVHTNDADINENGEVRYSVDSVAPPSLTDVFGVDPESGGIVTNLDITNEYTGTSSCSSLTEQSNNITLRIKATDQATEQPQLSNYTDVFIRLLDRNSEAPSFIPSNFYSFSISENVENVDIGTVQATDECDQDSVVTYVLVQGDDSEPFEIDERTGVIHLMSSLDRETNDLLVIQLEAVDDGTDHDPMPQTGFASISVHVLDENDNDPELLEDTFERSRPENIPVGTTLITLSASDQDLQENGTLSYRILSGDTDLFRLENPEGSNSDHLVTVTELDRETRVNHVVRVIVEDGGTSPKRSNMALMNLTLTDVNDNEPIWTAGHGTEFDIEENASSMLVVDLDAEDADEGINNELVYFFVEGSQDMGPFHIDRDNGTLYLSGELDYESPSKEYRLSVAVADRNGASNDQSVLRNTTTVTINVMDLNDNLPYFTKCPHTFEILETLTEGSVVGQGMVTSVNDLDTIENQFYFYLVNEDDVECNEEFCINHSTGQMRLEGNIDHEVKSMYTFYVVVSDRPNLTPEEAYSSPTIDLCETVATQNNNITKVEVSVIDVNDQQPRFDPDSLLAAVAEEAEFDTTVTRLKATDGDNNKTFSTVYYEIIAADPPYLVDRETGAVTTADVFTGRSGDIDKFPVVAYDNEGRDPSFTSTAVLTVRVFKQCQQIITVVDQTREDAKNCKPHLEAAIANETGYIIYTTKIRVRQDEELGVVDTTKSDVIFYTLHKTTGELVESQEIINIIERALDLQEEPINSVFQDCKVLNVKPFCSSENSVVSTDSISVVVGVVIGNLGAVILALLICLLCVCALERRKARKLRMRKKQNHDHSSQFSQFSQMATSNPIWMPPYEQWENESTTTAAQSTATDRENPLYESQELTIEMFQDDEDDMLSVASSRGNLSKMKPPKLTSTPGAHDSVYDDYDPLADPLGISGKPEDSKTSLI